MKEKYELSMLQKLRYPNLKPMVDDKETFQLRMGCLTLVFLIIVILLVVLSW